MSQRARNWKRRAKKQWLPDNQKKEGEKEKNFEDEPDKNK